MGRDIRSRLQDEIATEMHNVLTHQRSVEHAQAALALSKVKLSRSKAMLAALEGAKNEFSDVMENVEDKTPVRRKWWQRAEKDSAQSLENDCMAGTVYSH